MASDSEDDDNNGGGEEKETKMESPITPTFMDDAMTNFGFDEIDRFLKYGQQVAYTERYAIPVDFMTKWGRVRDRRHDISVRDDALYFFLVHYKHNLAVRQEIERMSANPARTAKFAKIMSQRLDWYMCGQQDGGKRVPREKKKKPIPQEEQVAVLYATTFREFAGKMRQVWNCI
jgi:hypothetical protein